MKEKAIICIQCGNSFVFSISEQERFRAQGFDEPRRCRDCRRKKGRANRARHEVEIIFKGQPARHRRDFPKNF